MIEGYFWTNLPSSFSYRSCHSIRYNLPVHYSMLVAQGNFYLLKKKCAFKTNTWTGIHSPMMILLTLTLTQNDRDCADFNLFSPLVWSPQELPAILASRTEIVKSRGCELKPLPEREAM